jgi:3-(3-hydroxy-phenyl)propionate hydroxylase
MSSDIPVWKKLKAAPMPSRPVEQTEVLIVGGGPVGLTLALDLLQRGRKVVLVSRYDFIAAGSKAICFAKRTLDIWDRLGVAQRMIEKGVIWNVGKVFAGSSETPLYQFDMLPVKGQKNPGFINLQQYYAEEFLIEAIEAQPGADLRWGHEVIDVKQHDTYASVAVSAPEGLYKIDAEWVIACDGSRSPIRGMLGLDFEGRIFEDNFLIADVKFKQERPSERWFWFDPAFNPGRSALLHKQPDDVWRLDFQLGWNIDREACIKPENVEPLVQAMLGPDVEFEGEWYSVYTFQCRRMRHFVHDRVIFAGDSAHLVSPFGARGCNGGVADADNLAWKLDLVLRGRSDVALIDSYNHEAIVAADENILNSSRSTDFMTPKSKVSHAFQKAVLELAGQHAFARPFVNSGRLSTAVSYPHSILNTQDKDIWQGGIPPGSPMVDAQLGKDWLMEKTGGDFVLLCNGGEIAVDGLRTIDLSKESCAETAIKRYALPPGGAYLIRPDQYVAARWHRPTLQGVETALNTASGMNAHAYA